MDKKYVGRMFLELTGLEAVSWVVDLEGRYLDAAFEICDGAQAVGIDLDLYPSSTLATTAEGRVTADEIDAAEAKLQRFEGEVQKFAIAYRTALAILRKEGEPR